VDPTIKWVPPSLNTFYFLCVFIFPNGRNGDDDKWRGY